MSRFRASLLLAGALASLALLAPGTGVAHRHVSSFRATIDYAVDGDTLRIREADGELAYVRLIGIDTPEDVKPGYPVECGARAAARSMERLAPEGAEVTLRYDSVADHHDIYGRILAHAFIGGRQLEPVQLRRGLAYVYDYEGQAFDGRARFYAAQDRARSEGRGSWSACGGDFHSAEPGKQN
ncbi:MAG: thermonuclease family protein [Actinobacteria bacterium]|nr:thermonuclease family protein [Actinomycetota bacterium]